MWFKNLKIYKFSKPFSVNTDTLQAQLLQMQFRACGSQETQSMGFVPLIAQGEQLFHADAQAVAFCLQTEERILPASVVNAELQTRVQVIEQETGAPVSKKAQKELKEDIINSLLPKAFTKRSQTRALLLRDAQLIMVDASSDKQGETVLACLRKCLDSLPAIPLVKSGQQQVLTSWLMQDCPEPYQLLDEAEFKSSADDGGLVKVKHHNLDADEVLAHVQAGKWVEKLAVEFDQRISFLLCEDLSVKRIKYADIIKEENQDIPKDQVSARFDADFTLFSAELDALCKSLQRVFADESAS